MRLLLLLPPLLLALPLLPGCHDDRRDQEFEHHEVRWKQWWEEAHKLERRVDDLETVRQLLRWHLLTGSERSHERALFDPTLVDRKVLFRLRRLENSPRLKERERRQVRYLRAYLMNVFVHRQAIGTNDKLVDLHLTGEVELASGATAKLYELDGLIAASRDRDTRQQLLLKRIPSLVSLEKVLLQRNREIVSEVKRLQISRFSITELLEERNTRKLLEQVVRINKDLGQVHLDLWQNSVSYFSGKPEKADLGDVYFLRQGGAIQDMMSSALTRSAAREVVDLLGLSLERVTRTATGVTTACVAVNPPMDVRLVHRPGNGMWSAVRLFEATGQAVCRTHDAKVPRTFMTLGPHLGARTLGMVLSQVWLERGWWKIYNELRVDAKVKPLSPDHVNDLIRTRLLDDLIRLRIQGTAVPTLRAVLSGAAPGVYEGVWNGDRDSRTADIFTGVLGRQMGFQPSYEQGLAYVLELIPDASFDLRAFVLSAMIVKKLRKEHGRNWFTDKKLGPVLLGQLCANGSGASARDLARQFGHADLDYDAPAALIQTSWRELMSGGK